MFFVIVCDCCVFFLLDYVRIILCADYESLWFVDYVRTMCCLYARRFCLQLCTNEYPVGVNYTESIFGRSDQFTIVCVLRLKRNSGILVMGL